MTDLRSSPPVTPTAPFAGLPRSSRVVSVDLLRGLILVIMALDHVRDYFTNYPVIPEDVPHSWGALFFTRWITHFCAPMFSFLAGTGAYLSLSGGKSRQQISWFLLTRGLWLVLLEFTVVSFAWTFEFSLATAQTIWTIGVSMIVLAALVWLPVQWIGGIGIAIIAFHNLSDRIVPAQFGNLGWLWIILHYPQHIEIIPQKYGIDFFYPLIPWVGVMATGYAFGAILRWPPKKRQRAMLLLGVSVTLVFLVLRGPNLYGNNPLWEHMPPLQVVATNGPWHAQPTMLMTIASFLNVQKYPPSLDYLLMTIGPSLILLSVFDRRIVSRGVGSIIGFFVTFGRVPMFFYILHLCLIHSLAALVAWLCHQPAAWLLHGAMFLNAVPPGYGQTLAVAYLLWAVVVGLLYFPCRSYASLKARRKDWWLSYL